jgi:hypothetical protein
VSVSMLNDDSTCAKAPGGPHQAGGCTARYRPHRLPHTPSTSSDRKSSPAASVSNRMIPFAGTSRVHSRTPLDRLPGETSGSTQVQPQAPGLRACRSRSTQKVASIGDAMICFEGTVGLLWSYALNLTRGDFSGLTGNCGNVTVVHVHTHMNSVRPPGGRQKRSCVRFTSLAGEASRPPEGLNLRGDERIT